jgi:hypothetical protein
MKRCAARLGLVLLAVVGTDRLNADEGTGTDNGASLSIEHEPLVCLTTSSYPRIEARISPAEDVQRAWVRFRSDPRTGWYAVQLKREGDAHVGLLPVPKRLKTFTYFLEASDGSATVARTPEYSPLVVGDAKACPEGTASSSVADARGLIVDRPPGSSQRTDPVPRGFGTRGTVGAVGMFDWSARSTSRIAGAIVIAGGGAALALSKGHTEGQAVAPINSTTYNMIFSTSMPPPGSQVSIARGSLVMRIAVRAIRRSLVEEDPPAFIAVDFFGPGSGAPCVEVVSPAHSPAGGVEEFMVSGPLVESSSCSPPFATSRVTGSLLTAGRVLVPGTSPFPFDAGYTFVP